MERGLHDLFNSCLNSGETWALATENFKMRLKIDQQFSGNTSDGLFSAAKGESKKAKDFLVVKDVDKATADDRSLSATEQNIDSDFRALEFFGLTRDEKNGKFNWKKFFGVEEYFGPPIEKEVDVSERDSGSTKGE